MTNLITFFILTLLHIVSKIGMHGLLYINFNLSNAELTLTFFLTTCHLVILRLTSVLTWDYIACALAKVDLQCELILHNFFMEYLWETACEDWIYFENFCKSYLLWIQRYIFHFSWIPNFVKPRLKILPKLLSFKFVEGTKESWDNGDDPWRGKKIKQPKMNSSPVHCKVDNCFYIPKPTEDW